MTRKRFVKLMMSTGWSRNEANGFAILIPYGWFESYQFAWSGHNKV